MKTLDGRRSIQTSLWIASWDSRNIHKRDNEIVVTMLKEPGDVDEKMVPKKVSMR